MPAQLQALNEGPSILLDKPILLLGRDLECDIRLDSRKISRRHCCIAQVGEQLVVRDLGSTNGIRVNGVRVLEGHLNAGDELTIGNYRYCVRWDGTLPAPAKARPKVAAAQQAPDDALLEECDEPVPLAESSVDVPRAQGVPASNPAIIPDSLELAPPSDRLLPETPGQPPANGQAFPPPVTPEGSDSFHVPPT